MVLVSQVWLSRMFDSLLVCISGFNNVLSIVFLSTDSMEIPEQFIDVADGVLGKNKSFLHTWVKINVCRTTNFISSSLFKHIAWNFHWFLVLCT